MKNVTINIAATWPGGTPSIQSWQNGDVFQETNCDLMAADVADRLGYLYGALAGKGGLAATNNWTQANNFGDTIQVTGDCLVTGAIEGGSLAVDGDSVMNGALEFGAVATHGTEARYDTVADAGSITVNASLDHVRIPTLTANRTYTVEDDPAPRDGAEMRFYRPGSDAYTVTIRRETALGGVTTLGILASAAPNTWLDILFKDGHWVVAGQSNDVSSLASTV